MTSSLWFSKSYISLIPNGAKGWMLPAWKELWAGKHHGKVSPELHCKPPVTALPQNQSSWKLRPCFPHYLLLLPHLLLPVVASCLGEVLSLAGKWNMSRSVRTEELLLALVDPPGVGLSSLALHRKYLALSCVLWKLKLQLLRLYLLIGGLGRKCESTYKNSHSVLFRHLTVLSGRCVRPDLV